MVLWALATSLAFGLSVTLCLVALILYYQIFFTNKRFKSDLVMIQVSSALLVVGLSVLHFIFI